MKRRVVITGLGLVSPLGTGVDYSWSRLISGKSGAGRIEKFDVSDLACKIACQIPVVDQKIDQTSNQEEVSGWFNPDNYLSLRERRRIDTFILYAIAAADEAIWDSKWQPEQEDHHACERTGVMIGSGIGGLETVYQASVDLCEKGPRRLGPFTIPSMLINLASGHVSIRYGFKGPNHSVVTACATSAHAIGDASRLIAYGDADVMIAGGSEAAICRLGIAGFTACRALSTNYNDTPTQASRPFDQGRDGFVMGEGAGILVLEEYEHAKARNAKIYGEVNGYGLSGDAHHITSPAEDGNGAIRAMRSALEDSGFESNQIDYINAHGTSTPVGDRIEVRAVETVFEDHVKKLLMSSTKSSIGHLLGAAGAVEAIFTIKSLQEGILPATYNLEKSDFETRIDLIPGEVRSTKIQKAMSNSFGFGGTNVSLIFSVLDR